MAMVASRAIAVAREPRSPERRGRRSREPMIGCCDEVSSDTEPFLLSDLRVIAFQIGRRSATATLGAAFAVVSVRWRCRRQGLG